MKKTESLWSLTQLPKGDILAVCPTNSGKMGRYIRAAGSTVTSGTYLRHGDDGEFQETWGMSLLGHTQVKHGKGTPTPRLEEFVLDFCTGQQPYPRAKPKKYPKKTK